MKTPMSHRTNRRRFLQASAGSSVGMLVGGCLSPQNDKAPAEQGEIREPASSSAPIAASGGIATRFWIDPSIAAWPPGPWRKVHIEYHKGAIQLTTVPTAGWVWGTSRGFPPTMSL